VLGVKPSVASAGSDLDLDKAFATVMQPTGPAIGACVITDQSSCDFLARERSARMVARGPHLRQCAFSAELHYQMGRDRRVGKIKPWEPLPDTVSPVSTMRQP
jgi:hypothetical protein